MTGMAVMDVMTPDPLTVAEDTTLEKAAVLMRDHKVGGLPVLEDGTLSGILTESDLFEAFIKVLGLRSGGARLTTNQANGTDTLGAIVSTIRDCEAGILSMSAYERHGVKRIVVRVDAPFPLHVVQTLVERGIDVTHLALLPKSGA
jgi:acetoin utilization protein AcuB